MDTNKLYLHCEECERGYNNPNEITAENSFLTLHEDFKAIAASDNDLKEHDWDSLELKAAYE